MTIFETVFRFFYRPTQKSKEEEFEIIENIPLNQEQTQEQKKQEQKKNIIFEPESWSDKCVDPSEFKDQNKKNRELKLKNKRNKKKKK